MVQLVSSLRCLALEGGFSLWEEYLHESLEYVDKFNNQRMEVRYEDLLTNPQKILGSVCEFCNIVPQEQCMETAIAGVKPDKANAYKTNPQLLAFAKTNQERLAQFYY